MAKDVITRFKLETTQYDSKLRDAAKGLADYTKTATNAGKEFQKFTKDNVEAARALGSVGTSMTSAKDRTKELVGAFNEAAKAYNTLTKEQQQSDFGKAMAASLTQLQQRIRDTKQEMQDLGNAVDDIKSKGSLFGEGGLTGMLQVAGGNLLAQGITKMGSELADTVQQSIQLARAGEGVRLAFDRLNQPDLLDRLKEATHGTVSEVELMKQAIKFDNFKLPLEDLATYLAFAQQKAKDTGESVDYMVNSITTGLGRQSKQILDNLGISAAELTKRMNEGADMTKAVADIIREEMAKAGDYIETAADKAARAAADAENEMEKFGRSAALVAEEFAQVWKALSIGAMDFANTLLGPVADSIRSLQNIWNNGWEDNIINSKFNLENGKYTPPKTGYQGMGKLQSVAAPGGYVEVTDKNTGTVIGGRHFENLSDKNSIKDWQKSLFKNSNKGGNSTKKEQTELQQNQTKINALTQEYVKLGDDVTEAARNRQEDIRKEIALLEERNNLLAVRAEQAKGKLLNDIPGVSMEIGGGVVTKSMQATMDNVMPKGGLQLDEKAMKAVTKQITDQNNKKIKDSEKNEVSISKGMSSVAGGVSQMVGGLEQLGVEIPQGLKDVLGGIQAIAAILTGISALISIITAIQGAKAVPVIGFLAARGGIVPKAAGGRFIGGNSYSGDNIFAGNAWVNSGELVLNKAQQSTLASQLEGGGMQGMKLSAIISGEQIRLVLNNNGRRTGKGEYVQTNFR